jgi:Spy/CpxP family protein refolding chaperone
MRMIIALQCWSCGRRFTLAACLAMGVLGTAAIHAAPGSTTQPARPGPAGREPGQMLKMLHERLDKLDLSADQKKQIAQIMSDTEAQIKQTMQETRGGSQDDRRQKFQTIMGDLREKIGGVLSDEQKQKLQQEMAAARAGNGGQANPLNRVRENLDKLALSDDQKSKASAVLDDAQKKMTDIREQLQNGNGDPQQAQEKGQAIRDDVKNKLADILTKEQQDKLHDLMEAGGGPGPGSDASPNGARRPAKGPAN